MYLLYIILGNVAYDSQSDHPAFLSLSVLVQLVDHGYSVIKISTMEGVPVGRGIDP